MKQIRTILVSATLTFGAFCAIVYTSCTKDKCSGVVCQNGGVCSGGNCECPTGFTGNRCQYSTVEYQNNSFTPITITVNGTTSTIQPGGVVDYAGNIDDAANATAYTSGTTSTGTQVGALVSWTIATTFPETGLTVIPLDVDPTYFYLKVVNTSVQNFTQLYVNYGFSSQTTDNIIIPNTGVVYGIGYYLGYSDTKIHAVGSAGSVDWSNLGIPNVYNASITISAN